MTIEHRTLEVFGWLSSFGITGKSVFYRTLLNKEHTHSYLDLEQCNLRVLAQSIPASNTTPSKIKQLMLTNR